MSSATQKPVFIILIGVLLLYVGYQMLPETKILPIHPEKLDGEAFLKWATEKGMLMPKGHVYNFDGLRGVIAIDDIAPQEYVAVVPIKYMLTCQSAKMTPIGRYIRLHSRQRHIMSSLKVYQRAFHKNEEEELAVSLKCKEANILRLLYEFDQISRKERGEKYTESELEPYFRDMMVLDLPNSVFWSEEKLRSGSVYLREHTSEANELILQSWLKTIPKLAKRFPDFFGSSKKDAEMVGGVTINPAYNFEAWKRAYVIFDSRYWNLELIAKERSQFMVPVADLFNMSPEKSYKTRARMVNNGTAFAIVAVEPIAQGEQIYFYYASSCIEDFLIEYGFSLPYQKPCQDSA